MFKNAFAATLNFKSCAKLFSKTQLERRGSEDCAPPQRGLGRASSGSWQGSRSCQRFVSSFLPVAPLVRILAGFSPVPLPPQTVPKERGITTGRTCSLGSWERLPCSRSALRSRVSWIWCRWLGTWTGCEDPWWRPRASFPASWQSTTPAGSMSEHNVEDVTFWA